MKSILAQTTANNQVKIRYVDRPKCYPSKDAGDLSATRKVTNISRHQQKVEEIDKILTHTCKEYEHTNYTSLHPCKDNTTRVCLSSIPPRTENFGTIPARYLACELNNVRKYFCEDSLRVVTSTYRCLANEKRRALDIIKKSQQPSKAHDTWGSPQSVKSFSSNAKTRILEAGAVVDKYCPKEATFEVTTTIPGSGYEVYDCVARWSGWIVNRMSQVIRRLEAKGYEIYWFFVWEHQKRGALHQHWCVASPEGAEFAKNVGRLLVVKWYELLAELSDKEEIDLFKKKGSLGTWRNTPKVWQYHVKAVRKSVAAYFSKYCSKNASTSRYNKGRRQASKNQSSKNSAFRRDRPLYTLCPSRYWGANARIKRLCAQYRVSISFAVASSQEGDFLASIIQRWCDEVSSKVQEVSRTFRAVSADTGFLYAQGWEWTTWFQANTFDNIIALFRRLHSNQERKRDAIGAIVSLDDF